MDDAKLFREILTAYGGKPCAPNAKFLTWLRSQGLSEQAIGVISGYLLKKSAYVGPVDFYSERGILWANGDEGIPIPLRDGLLIVGACPNGDPVAVDVKEHIGAAGYIGHESMWQRESVRSVFLALVPALGKLAEGLDEKRLPYDYYEAKNRQDGGE